MAENNNNDITRESLDAQIENAYCSETAEMSKTDTSQKLCTFRYDTDICTEKNTSTVF